MGYPAEEEPKGLLGEEELRQQLWGPGTLQGTREFHFRSSKITKSSLVSASLNSWGHTLIS